MCISVISDEISRDFITASEILKKYKIKNIELRTLRTGRVPYITLEEEREIDKYIEKYNLIVDTISPAIGKLNILTEDLREKTIKHLNDSIDYSLRHGIKRIIIFSFRKKNKYDFNEVMPSNALEIIKDMEEMAYKKGIELLLENHSSCYISTNESIVNLLQDPEFHDIKLNWDPNNSYQVNKLSYQGELPQFIKNIKSIHVKDTFFKNDIEHRVPLNDGKVGWNDILLDLKRLGYHNRFTIETHYEPFFENTLRDLEILRELLK